MMNGENSKCNYGKVQTVNSQATRAKLAQALITIVTEQQPPLHFLAGADAIATTEQVATTLQQQTNVYR
ncbi:MAG: hypothetical protein JWQ09_1527 [Segetibacter sp.]|nr:hypothetical protein [Segetibacter sp.]